MENNKDNKKINILHLIALNNMSVIKCKKEDIQSILQSNPGSSYIGPIRSY